jgi:superoxide dismutase, Cu-Zn family
MKRIGKRAKLLTAAVPLVGMCFFGCWDDDDDDDVESENGKATAEIRGYTGNTLHGALRFENSGDSLFIHGDFTGLPTGAHGFHVHQIGNCMAPGEHFGAPAERHGNPLDSLEHHRGDMPNLVADSAGVAHFEFRTADMTLGDGSHSVVNRSVVIHANPDDYVSQPSGNSGLPIACGVIKRNGNGGTDTTKGDTIIYR